MSSLGREYFLSSGFTRACLKEEGKVPSVRARLIRVVIGKRSESRQSLRSFVGMRSRAHVEFEEEIIAFRTSIVEAGKKCERRGGAMGGAGFRSKMEAGVSGVN
jgi:hypothetical protein